MIREMNFQYLEATVDGLNQAYLVGEGVDRADATDGHTARALADLIVNVAGGHHGFGTAAEVRLVQTSLDATLAVGQFLSYDLVHSKSLHASGVRETGYLIEHPKNPGISKF